MESKNRSLAQNRALHLAFTQIADEMVAKGIDLKALMEVKEVGVPMNPDLVKETMWRPLQMAITGKESSTKLTTQEIDLIFAPLQKVLNEKLGMDIHFPSMETMRMQSVIMDEDKQENSQ